MTLFDCHCHLTDSAFDYDRQKIIKDSIDHLAGLAVVSSGLYDATSVIELAKEYPNKIYPCIGMHPEQFNCRSVCSIREVFPIIQFIRENANHLIAIGEVGLDFTPRCLASLRNLLSIDMTRDESSVTLTNSNTHSNTSNSNISNAIEKEDSYRHILDQEKVASMDTFLHTNNFDASDLNPIAWQDILKASTEEFEAMLSIKNLEVESRMDITTLLSNMTDETVKAIQRAIFAVQIRLACELSLPLNIHSRSAGHHAIEMVLAAKAPPSLFHAFDGKAKYALQAVQEGNHFFSIAPILVRSPQLQKFVRVLPLSSLVLESDAPALAPINGTRNVPSNILEIVDCISKLKNISRDQVQATLQANTKKLFPKIDVLSPS